MFFDAGYKIPGGFPNITSRTAWTGEFVNNPALEHFLSRRFERWHQRFQFSERHNDITRGPSLVEGTCVVFSDLSTILDFERRFLCFGG